MTQETQLARVGKMNRKQGFFLGAAIFVIVLMGLFPPWIHTFNYQGIYSEEPGGYAFIFDPPAASSKWGTYHHGLRLDVSRLLLQWAIVGIAVAGLVWVLKRTTDQTDRPKPSLSESNEHKKAEHGVAEKRDFLIGVRSARATNYMWGRVVAALLFFRGLGSGPSGCLRMADGRNFGVGTLIYFLIMLLGFTELYAGCMIARRKYDGVRAMYYAYGVEFGLALVGIVASLYLRSGFAQWGAPLIAVVIWNGLLLPINFFYFEKRHQMLTEPPAGKEVR